MLVHLQLSWATLVALGGHGAHLGLILGHLWVPLDAPLGPTGPPARLLLPLLDLSCSIFGSILGHLGPNVSHLGAILAPFGSILGASSNIMRVPKESKADLQYYFLAQLQY